MSGVSKLDESAFDCVSLKFVADAHAVAAALKARRNPDAMPGVERQRG
jgi:hypothetical protein